MAAAGIPGTGVGGLFYVLTGLLAPVRHVWRRLTGRPTTSSFLETLVSALLAFGVIAGIWAAGWLLGLLLPGHVLQLHSPSRAGRTTVVRPNVVLAAAIASAFGTLFVVLVAVEAARLARSPRFDRRVSERDEL